MTGYTPETPLDTQGPPFPKMRRLVKTVPIDLRGIVDWVIYNFKANEPDNAPGQGAGTPTSGVSVTDGTTTVPNVTLISFDGTLFTVSDGGGGVANVTLITESCS